MVKAKQFLERLAIEGNALLHSPSVKTGVVIGTLSLALPAIAHAGIPWEAPIQSVADSLSGPVTKNLCVLAIVMTGAGAALNIGGDMVQRGIRIVLGISMALLATSFISDIWTDAK